MMGDAGSSGPKPSGREETSGKLKKLREILTLQEEIRTMVLEDTRIVKDKRTLIMKAMNTVCSAYQTLLTKYSEDVGARKAFRLVEGTIQGSGGKAGPSSYAEAIGGSLDTGSKPKIVNEKSKKISAPPARHTAIIRGKPESDLTVQDIRKEFTRAVKPSSDKIRIKGMREARDSLAVELGSDEDLKRLEKLEKLNRALVVDKPRKKLPKLIIYEVPSAVKKEDIERYAQLNAPVSADTGIFKALTRIGKPDAHDGHWIVEVSPAVRKELLCKGRFYLGFCSYKVKDHTVPVRFMKCCEFGHIAKNCSRLEEKCKKCGSTDHEKKDCESNKNCALCEEGCKGDKSCPACVRALRILIENTDYDG